MLTLVIEFVGAIANLPAAPWMRSVAPRAAIAARSDNLVAVLLAVKSGVGLAALPVPLAEPKSDPVAVLGPLPELTHPFYLVMHRDMRHTPRVRAFSDFVTAEIKTFRLVLSGEAKRQKQ